MSELGHIADIRTGYPFRKGPERVERGGCLLVQMKDLDPSGALRSGEIERIEVPADAQRQRLRPGDVLMAARGNRNAAVTFAETGPDAALPASHLLVLRSRGSVLPEYLAWFLNLPETQERLAARRVGSTIPFVSVQALSELPVPVPDVETQKRIVEVYKLVLEEQALLDQIKAKRRILVDGLLRNARRRDSKT